MRRVIFAGEELETIGENAFSDSGLESFTAPASLKKVGDFAFSECGYLKHVDFSACTIQSGCENDFFGTEVFKES